MAKVSVTVAANGMLTYAYRVNKDMAFRFHTLAEVGQPYQPEARAILARKRIDRETRHLNHAPWVADFAKGKRK